MFIKPYKLIVKAILVSFIALAGMVGYIVFFPHRIPNDTYQLVVNKDESVQAITNDLATHNIIQNKFIFRGLLRLSHKDRKVTAGLYFLKHSMSTWGIISRITNGKPDQISVTIIDGWSFEQVKSYIDKLPNIQHTTSNYTDTQLRAALKISYPNLDGIFYPSTYFIAPNQTDLEIYNQAYRLMQVRLESYFVNRSPYSNYANPYELLIMASLIEKETRNKEDMVLISTVFNNRIKTGMKLQDDPAVFYGLHHQLVIGRKDFATDTPYNTYLHNGLPPTPICIPSENALFAASQPINKPQLLYFLAIGGGKTKFSATYSEHQAAINTYLKK